MITLLDPIRRLVRGTEVVVAVAILAVVFGVGYWAGQSVTHAAHGRAVQAGLAPLRDSIAELLYWRAVDRAAAQRAEAVARAAEQRAHDAAERAAAVRGRVRVVGPVVVAAPVDGDSAVADTLATDPRVAAALAAQDTALADAARARVLLLAALDSVGRERAASDSVIDAQRRLLAKQDTVIADLGNRLVCGGKCKVVAVVGGAYVGKRLIDAAIDTFIPRRR